MNPVNLILPLMLIFDFSPTADLENWAIVNDTVMGGRSDATLTVSEDGHGVFSGHVSLENNGGFSSLRYGLPERADVSNYAHAVVRLRGDGKIYQFRVKSANRDRQSYVTDFKTSGEWEEVRLPLREMVPRFRGRALDLPAYPGQTLSEVRFLIGNKRAEDFRLEIDRIRLE